MSEGNGGMNRAEIDFHSSEVEHFCLHLRPTHLSALEINDDPERHPPWDAVTNSSPIRLVPV